MPAATGEVHADYLVRLAAAMPGDLEDPEMMLEYFQAALPAEAAVRIEDRKGGVLADAGRQLDRTRAVFSEYLPSTSGRWRVRVGNLAGTEGRPNPLVGRDMRRSVKVAYLLLIR